MNLVAHRPEGSALALPPILVLDGLPLGVYQGANMGLHVHPFAVHFPIALVVLVLLLDWGRWIFDRHRLLSGGFWDGTTPILILALLGAALAIVSGLAAEEVALTAGIDHELIEQHELAAFLAAGGLAILTFWRLALRGGFPRAYRYGYLLLLLVVAGAVGYGACIGGLMVYGSGVTFNPIP